FFLVWSLVFSDSPTERIERVCEPINWSGRLLESFTSAVTPGYAETVGGAFDKLNNGCKYVIWSAFYKDEYEKWLNSQNGGGQASE
ncbi:hypothetical protein, partial [Vibrio vulnificus]|uniref:hypothetical protein n=1 Tax=Vibrio vulnificus TaxID=672 RepID=UPI0039B5AFD3